jgi:hypothetical protein
MVKKQLTPEQLEQDRLKKIEIDIADYKKEGCHLYKMPEHRKILPGDTVRFGNIIMVVSENQDGIIVGKDIAGYVHVRPWFECFDPNIETVEFPKVNDPIVFGNADINSLMHTVLFTPANLDPEYQRGLVWSENDKTLLYDSIMDGLNIGTFVFVFNTYDSHFLYDVIDGKQRISAILDLIMDKQKYRGSYWSELSAQTKRQFMGHPVQSAKLHHLSKKQRLETFIRLNTRGVDQTTEHLKKVKEMLKQEDK